MTIRLQRPYMSVETAELIFRTCESFLAKLSFEFSGHDSIMHMFETRHIVYYIIMLSLISI